MLISTQTIPYMRIEERCIKVLAIANKAEMAQREEMSTSHRLDLSLYGQSRHELCDNRCVSKNYMKSRGLEEEKLYNGMLVTTSVCLFNSSSTFTPHSRTTASQCRHHEAHILFTGRSGRSGPDIIYFSCCFSSTSTTGAGNPRYC